jgi:N-acetylmuramic acid 6-phosphate etherase
MNRRVNYARLSTEQPNPMSRALDRLSPLAVVTLMNREDRKVPAAVGRVARQIAQAVALIVGSLASGGRLFFVGAGTSGRLGVMEAAECPPTFNTPPGLVQAIVAGGRGSVFRSSEGAEDRESEARRAVRRRVRAGDVVVGIAASGVTPFVGAALREAKRRGAGTVLVACDARSPARSAVDVSIIPRVGPEVLTGSTRLKAGSATKMVLNMLTTAAMVQLGKVYENRMVDLQPRSRKLRERALRLVQELGKVSEPVARRLLRSARGRAKVAIVMARLGLGARDAERRLAAVNGALSRCLEAVPRTLRPPLSGSRARRAR